MLLWAYLAHLLDSNGVRALSEPQHSSRPSARRHETYRQQQIKFREPFRLFAPLILEGRADDFFQGLGDPVPNYPVRYMLLVMRWKDDAGARLPAVNHMGTGRLQTLRREWNPRCYRLME